MNTRLSVLNIVERSITSDRLVVELGKAFKLWGGPPQVLRMGNRPEFIPHALNSLRQEGRYLLSPARHAVEQRAHRIVQFSPAKTAISEPTWSRPCGHRGL